MANKKSNKKKVQTKEEPKAASTQVAKAEPKKASAPAKKAAKAKKNSGKPGVLARAKSYLSSVRSEMKRVVWPTKKELVNYSVAVCASLVVVGIVIALLDAVISGGLVLFAGLRG